MKHDVIRTCFLPQKIVNTAGCRCSCYDTVSVVVLIQLKSGWRVAQFLHDFLKPDTFTAFSRGNWGRMRNPKGELEQRSPGSRGKVPS
jgi:hypothetical protein